MFLSDSTSVQTPEVPKLLSNVIFGAFEVTAPAVHDGCGGGMPPQLLIQPVPGLGVVVSGAVVAGAVVSGAVSAGQLMATETPPFLMSTENE